MEETCFFLNSKAVSEVQRIHLRIKQTGVNVTDVKSHLLQMQIKANHSDSGQRAPACVLITQQLLPLQLLRQQHHAGCEGPEVVLIAGGQH